MTDAFNTPTTGATKDEWLTPPELIKSLGEFSLDPCAPPRSRRPWDMAKEHYALEDGQDGLTTPWSGRVWLNPPYGAETFKWMERMAEHRAGIALIFARSDTKGFHREIFKKATGIFFMKGRIRFWHQPFASIADDDPAKLQERREKSAQKYFGTVYALLTAEQLVQWCLGDAPNAASCLVAYSKTECTVIQQSGLQGHLCILKHGD